MPTSGTATYSINRQEIIQQALEEIGVLGEGDTATAGMMSVAGPRLNNMVKAWMAEGYHLWALTTCTLFVEPGTAAYSISSTGANCTASYVQTTLTADAALGASTVTLASVSGVATTYRIGVVLDSGAIHWTTVNGAPAGLVVTLTAVLPSAAASGNVVFCYATRINRPLRVHDMYRRSIDGNDVPVGIISRAEYSQLSNKSTSSKPVQAYYDKQLTSGVLYLWPTPDLATDVIRFTAERPLEDIDSQADEPDFPIEWAEALVLGLASRLCMPFGRQSILVSMKAMADEALDAASGWDKEDVAVSFEPNVRGW